MVSITLSVPENLKSQMDSFPEINWSAIARDAIKKRITMMNRFEMFVRDSEFTKEDALKLGREMNKNLAKKYK